MTDRELLERAARAAGVEWSEDEGHGWYQADGLWTIWDPLADDGDALRLAVKLKIDLQLWIRPAVVTAKTNIGAGRGIPLHGGYVPPINDHTEPIMADEMAATRRAIVRAAAAMDGSAE